MSSRTEAERDGVVVPLTQEDYCIKTKVKPDTEPVDMYDFYDDDYDIDDDDDDDEQVSDNGELTDLYILLFHVCVSPGKTETDREPLCKPANQLFFFSWLMYSLS